MKKYIKIFIIVIGLLLLCSACQNFSAAENTAVEFTENMYAGNGEECAKLMSKQFIDDANYETEKLFIKAFDDTLDDIVEEYQDNYGKRWTYEISVIDCFEYTSMSNEYEYEYEGTPMKVVICIEHKGKGLFNEKEGEDEVTIIMAKEKGKWRVFDFY